jgi:hypothetical protein
MLVSSNDRLADAGKSFEQQVIEAETFLEQRETAHYALPTVPMPLKVPLSTDQPEFARS